MARYERIHQATPTFDVPLEPVKHARVTISNSVATIANLFGTVAGPKGQEVQLVMVFAEDGDIRFTDDGTTPSATLGYPIRSGAQLFIPVLDPSTLKFFGPAIGANVSFALYA